MNFVIFSYHFLPMAGAESYCTTRFASALAAAGHDVQVVTMDWPTGVSDEVYRTLVDPRLKITRVPIRAVSRAPVWSRIRYLTHEWEAVNLARCIRTLRSVLKTTDRPILVSRTHPIASLIVAWHCRRSASKWIAHLSDPIPFYGGRMKRALMRFWCKRAFRDADRISVTCEHAIRFYRENYGRAFVEGKCIVTPHIGDPWLSSGEVFRKGDDLPMVVHTGLFYAGRGALPLLSAIRELNEAGFPCRFVQVGEVDAPIRDVFRSVPNVIQIDDLSPLLAAAVVEAADVLFVSDVDVPGDYIPYMPSKFAYQIFTDKPIVVFSKADSPMGACCRRYPKAGFFFVDSSKPSGLAGAIGLAMSGPRKSAWDRGELRCAFGPSSAIAMLLDSCGDPSL